MGVGVTGDGDTASIGLGQFMHLVRRNMPLIYIIENNGVYGLTKGQFSATADVGSTLKTGTVNDLPPFDCCALALEWGATFVARSFSGDKKQLQAILKAAIAHSGLVRDRRDLALRDLQRPRGLHQELQLHEGARSRCSTSWTSCPHYEDIVGRDRRKAKSRTWRCTTARTSASANWIATTTPPAR